MRKPLSDSERKRVLAAHAKLTPLLKQYVATSPAISEEKKKDMAKVMTIMHNVLQVMGAEEARIRSQRQRKQSGK